jgi:ATP-dependent Lhr-like helicase
MGLTQLIGHGRITSDSFGGLRRLITPPSKRRGVMKRAHLTPAGRWSRFRDDTPEEPAAPRTPADDQIEFVARQLLDRYGVVFRRLIDRERVPVPWRDLVRVYRHHELRGDIRGGRFVHRFSGEQYARPEAIELMRRLRRTGGTPRLPSLEKREGARGIEVAAADPLNLQGVLTPEPRIPAQARGRVRVA